MKGMISLKNVTKIAFVAAGISGIIKFIDIMREMGIVYIPDGDAGAVILKIFEAIFPIAMALFFYVLHSNQKK